MTRRHLGRALVRFAACKERLADGLDLVGTEPLLVRAARLRTSAMRLRRRAVAMMLGRAARWH